MHREQRAAAWVMGAILTGAGLACTTAQEAATAGAGKPAGQGACFNVRMVDSFSPVGNRFVYVRMTGDRQYLLTLDAVYQSLPFATGIAISGNVSWVCSNTGAMITFKDAGRPIVARILGVKAVASLDEAKRLVAQGK